MRKAGLVLIFSLFTGLSASSQNDSVKYVPEIPLDDGVFITYADFRRSKPILSENIVSKINRDQLGFVGKTMEEENLKYKVGNSEFTTATKEIWGYVQNGTFYINFKGKFYRIPVFGSISFLVAQVEVQSMGFYDQRFGTYTGATTSIENREFLMNFYDGNMVELKMELVDKLLSRDKVIYEEYNKLNARKQKEQLYRFIRKFNEANPVYFLKG